MNFAQYVTALRNAIRQMYGCEAVHLRSEGVEVAEGEATLWEGNVECFALMEYAVASQCYGWGMPPDEGAKEYVVVLHKAPVDTARRAVQSWLLRRR